MVVSSAGSNHDESSVDGGISVNTDFNLEPGRRLDDPSGNGGDGDVMKLAQQENRFVWLWKTILLVVILAASALVSFGTFWVLNQEDTDDYDKDVSPLPRFFCF